MEEKEILLEILAYVKNFDVKLEQRLKETKEEIKVYVDNAIAQAKEEMKLYVDSAIEKNTKEIAKKMLESKIDVKTISNITGLTKEEIEAIQ